jgi:SNF2 family DNA or RNA helicase
VIPSRAIRKFLDRKRDSHEHWKDFSDEKLDRLASNLRIHPPIWRELNKRQKICLLLGIKYKRFAFLSDTGTGKTFLCIALSRYFIECGARGIFLALVPRKTNKVGWAKQIKKHSPASRCLVLSGSSEEKWRALRSTNADIVVESYGGLLRLLTTEGKTKKGRPRLKPSRAKVEELQGLLSGLFLDESTEIKNKIKLPWRLCYALSKACKYVFPLTATPMGKDPKDIWPQIFLVDDGWSMGETLGLFRAAFYSEIKGHWAVEYHFLKKNRGMLHEFLQHRSIAFEADKSELPTVKPYLIRAKLSEEATPYYEKHRDAFMKSRGNYNEMENSFIRMRQISSGFVGYKDADTDHRAHFEFKSKPKLEKLVKFLWDHDGKALIFHEYKPTGRMLVKRLASEGIGCELLNGDNSDDSERIMTRFEEDEDCEVLAINNSMGAKGLNFQIAKWGLFFESPLSPIDRYQARRRVERQFSPYKWVGIVDFVTEGTIDEQILDAHEEGYDLFEAIVRGRKKVR